MTLQINFDSFPRLTKIISIAHRIKVFSTNAFADYSLLVCTAQSLLLATLLLLNFAMFYSFHLDEAVADGDGYLQTIHLQKLLNQTFVSIKASPNITIDLTIDICFTITYYVVKRIQ